MYFWKVNELAKELAKGTVSERHRFFYFLFPIEIISRYDLEPITNWDLASWVLTLAIIVSGLTMCFQANQKGDGKDFVGRFVCLFLPITIRLLVYIIPVILLSAYVGGMVDELTGTSSGTEVSTSLTDEILGLSVGLLFEAGFYMWMYRQIKMIAEAKTV